MKKICNIGELVAKRKEVKKNSTEQENCALSIVTQQQQQSKPSNLVVFRCPKTKEIKKTRTFSVSLQKLSTLLGDYILEKNKQTSKIELVLKEKKLPKNISNNPLSNQ